MGRATKIAAVAVLGGLLMTLAILHVSSPPAPDAPEASIARTNTRAITSAVSERCRTVTTADAECAAAWEAKRRQFFGQKD